VCGVSKGGTTFKAMLFKAEGFNVSPRKVESCSMSVPPRERMGSLTLLTLQDPILLALGSAFEVAANLGTRRLRVVLSSRRRSPAFHNF
jgi:hypothetical protein